MTGGKREECAPLEELSPGITSDDLLRVSMRTISVSEAQVVSAGRKDSTRRRKPKKRRSSPTDDGANKRAPSSSTSLPSPSTTTSKTTNSKKKSREFTGRWTTGEHQAFLRGLKEHGKHWKQIAELIPTRTVVQIRTHAQKYFQKVAKAKRKSLPNSMSAEDYKRAISIARPGGGRGARKSRRRATSAGIGHRKSLRAKTSASPPLGGSSRTKRLRKGRRGRGPLSSSTPTTKTPNPRLGKRKRTHKTNRTEVEMEPFPRAEKLPRRAALPRHGGTSPAVSEDLLKTNEPTSSSFSSSTLSYVSTASPSRSPFLSKAAAQTPNTRSLTGAQRDYARDYRNGTFGDIFHDIGSAAVKGHVDAGADAYTPRVSRVKKTDTSPWTREPKVTSGTTMKHGIDTNASIERDDIESSQEPESSASSALWIKNPHLDVHLEHHDDTSITAGTENCSKLRAGGDVSVCAELASHGTDHIAHRETCASDRRDIPLTVAERESTHATDASRIEPSILASVTLPRRCQTLKRHREDPLGHGGSTFQAETDTMNPHVDSFHTIYQSATNENGHHSRRTSAFLHDSDIDDINQDSEEDDRLSDASDVGLTLSRKGSFDDVNDLETGTCVLRDNGFVYAQQTSTTDTQRFDMVDRDDGVTYVSGTDPDEQHDQSRQLINTEQQNRGLSQRKGHRPNHSTLSLEPVHPPFEISPEAPQRRLGELLLSPRATSPSKRACADIMSSSTMACSIRCHTDADRTTRKNPLSSQSCSEFPSATQTQEHLEDYTEQLIMKENRYSAYTSSKTIASVSPLPPLPVRRYVHLSSTQSIGGHGGVLTPVPTTSAAVDAVADSLMSINTSGNEGQPNEWSRVAQGNAKDRERDSEGGKSMRLIAPSPLQSAVVRANQLKHLMEVTSKDGTHPLRTTDTKTETTVKGTSEDPTL